MKHDAALHAAKREAILERMAISRSQLLAARAVHSQRSSGGLPTRVGETIGALRDAPHVSMLLAMCVAALVFGPRRMITMAARTGTAAWLTKTVRSNLGR